MKKKRELSASFGKYEPKKMAVSQKPKDLSSRGTKRERERVSRVAKRQVTGNINMVDSDRRASSSEKVKTELIRLMKHRPVRIGLDNGQRRPVAQSSQHNQQHGRGPIPKTQPQQELVAQRQEELSVEQLRQCARLSHDYQLREAAREAVQQAFDDDTDSETSGDLNCVRISLQDEIAFLSQLHRRIDNTMAKKSFLSASKKDMTSADPFAEFSSFLRDHQPHHI
uniref:Uncharacterized protein n=1 Tax=Aureoumbra lagunensis TaxID=44058 RepID=A0A7S3JTQ9_9STRA|mmetsp:Transcript_19063/g.24713  ORF Transcript_19063/g.24713 Transcript_19063/m.24713 type:complete len:225 (+) Transcript_19063:62-736(+)